MEKFLVEDKTLGDLEEFGMIRFCLSTGAESENKRESESGIARQCWSLWNVYFSHRNAESSHCLFVGLGNCFYGKSQIFLVFIQ